MRTSSGCAISLITPCVSCTGPRACYDESKRYGETLCVNFQKVHGVPVVCVRPFNNYGPGLRITDRRVLPDFFRDALAGRNIVMLSDGRATRTFCYVADAIEGYLRAMLIGRPGEAYNIGTASPEISMADLAQAVIRTTGAKVRVVYSVSDDKHYTTDNPQRRCPDITKASQELLYAPRVGLEAGLQRTFEFYRDNPEE
jgi:UDP-glucuronate decarboxylase